MQKKKKTGILVLGIGNLLMGDEGLGVHYARRMEQESLPEEVTVLDGGTVGFNLMEALENHEHVIMVDATLDGRPEASGRCNPVFPRRSAPTISA